jgi:hypothetical protein
MPPCSPPRPPVPLRRRHAVLRWCLALAAVLAAPTLAGETQDWCIGQAIPCPLPLSTPTHDATRTVVFPGGALADVPVFWDPETQLCVKAIRNTLVLQLRDPQFSGTLQVYDDKGGLYLLAVRAAAPGEEPDAVLLVRPKAARDEAAAAAVPADSDAQVTQMMAAMVGGCDGAVTGSVVTRVEDGKVVVGRRIFADATLTLELVRVFQGPILRGYECLLSYHGKHSVRLDQSRLWFPGALAVYASAQAVIDPQTVAVEIAPGAAITLDYVAAP